MASTEGGMDIEEVAAKTPEKIFKEWIDPATGIMPYQARKIAAALGLKGDLFNAAAKIVAGVFTTWWECDASLVEINPMCVVELPDGKETVVALDAKISLDDNGALPPQGHPGNARSERGGAAGNRGQQVQPQLHQAGRQHRLPGQRRRPGHGHHGHHPAFRRHARRIFSTWAAARARNR